jgi:hypothetical protein
MADLDRRAEPHDGAAIPLPAGQGSATERLGQAPISRPVRLMTFDNRTRARHHQGMEVTAAATIWAMFSCFLLFPLLGFPALMRRSAMALLVAELVALAMWSYGSADCVERPCSAVAETGRTAAAFDVPVLSACLVVIAILRGVRSWRRARQRVAA